MTEEEKEAIENLRKDLKENIQEDNKIDNYKYISNLYSNGDIEAVLNYIEKLQKENKELKEKNTILGGNKTGLKLAIQELKEENKQLRDSNKQLYEMGKQRAIQEILNENWVNKDKIRELIKELEKSENVGISDIYEIKKEFAIEILKGLL